MSTGRKVGGDGVRVTREQAAGNRRKIVHVASTLFRRHGFEGIGVADIMKGAGLTHGGFYGHFASKDDLAAEACTGVLAGDDWAERLAGTPNPSLGAVIRGYMSPRHRDDPAHGCLLAALGSDVVRQPRAVRRAVTEGVRFRVDALLKLLPRRPARAQRQRALAP